MGEAGVELLHLPQHLLCLCPLYGHRRVGERRNRGK
jgi:hypothetical protein